MAAATNPLRSALAGISPRERRMLIGLASVLVVGILGGMYWWSSSVLDDLEHDRAAAVDALRTIRDERPRIRQRQDRRARLAARYAIRAPALTSFVEDASHDAHVTVAQATDRSQSTPDAHHFQRRAVAITLHNVDLQSLTHFMERIEGARFPVAITSIRVTKRFGQSNTYDVDDMVIATWDRDTPGAAHAPASNATPSTGTPTNRPSTPPPGAAPTPPFALPFVPAAPTAAAPSPPAQPATPPPQAVPIALSPPPAPGAPAPAIAVPAGPPPSGGYAPPASNGAPPMLVSPVRVGGVQPAPPPPGNGP